MPHEPVPLSKREFARSQRREPTDAEDRLWEELRDRRLDGAKFRRQVPVPPYTADFLCARAKLVVEVDGGQHGESVSDPARTRFLNARGFRVLRFWNEEVLREMDAVCDTIIAFVRDPTLQPWR
ncbi:MAG: endonuclease domain-containing protein [Mesorhizobium sp.]|nr:endonuclease domain-containing protein [Mesorhizobium sp.]MCO5164362.1 endonuclease domain-containing protein [Mesorhizobium sp.]